MYEADEPILTETLATFFGELTVTFTGCSKGSYLVLR